MDIVSSDTVKRMTMPPQPRDVVRTRLSSVLRLRGRQAETPTPSEKPWSGSKAFVFFVFPVWPKLLADGTAAKPSVEPKEHTGTIKLTTDNTAPGNNFSTQESRRQLPCWLAPGFEMPRNLQKQGSRGSKTHSFLVP